jgi:hypothetical protein
LLGSTTTTLPPTMGFFITSPVTMTQLRALCFAAPPLRP